MLVRYFRVIYLIENYPTNLLPNPKGLNLSYLLGGLSASTLVACPATAQGIVPAQSVIFVTLSAVALATVPAPPRLVMPKKLIQRTNTFLMHVSKYVLI